MLQELNDADTGHSVVAAIDHPSAEHTGSRAVALPDLLVRYTPGTFPRAVVSTCLGRIEAKRPNLRPGDHAAGGILFSLGETVTVVNGMQDLGNMAAKVMHVTL